MLITHNVYKLDCTRGAYVYAIQEADGVTLIDTGFPGRGGAMLKELASLGIAANDVKRILLTHSDGDHIGNARFLADQTGCDVYISADDLPVAVGRKRAAGFKRPISLVQRATLPESTRVLPDGAIGSFHILRTPGHTPGHVCFRYRDVLFAGDLVRGGKDGFVPSPALFTEDMLSASASIEALNMDGIEWICPAHGEPRKADRAWPEFLKAYM